MKSLKYYNLGLGKWLLNTCRSKLSDPSRINKSLYDIYGMNLLHSIEDPNRKILFLEEEYLDQHDFENINIMIPFKRP